MRKDCEGKVRATDLEHLALAIVGFLVDSAETIGIEDFGLKHKIGWDVDNHIVWRLVILLKLDRHSFRLYGRIWSGLK